jgi:hypothetical protein
VVLLIDEVDSPVTTNLDNPPLRMENAKAMEAFLSALLAKRDKIRFSFLAGVIKPFDEFGQKLSTLFKDISLSTRYGGICGITVEEFFKLYKEPLGEILDLLRREDEISPIKTIEDLKNEIVTWYQGYSFDGESKVYDPTSLNTFLENAAWDYYFAEKRLDPSLLKDTIKTPELLFPRDDLTFSRGSLLSVKDFSPVSPTLLYQKGIFTISEKREEQGVTEYVLGFPNHEVERSFHLLALEKLSGEDEPKVTAFIRDFKEKATNAEHEALAYTLKNFLLKASSYLHFKENKVSNANASESSNEKNKDLNRRKGADKKIVRKEKRSRLDIKKDDRNEESGIFLSDFERYPSKLTLGSEDYQQKEEELSPHIKGLSSRITAILNLILSLSGFHLKRQIPDSLTAQGVLKHPSGGKSILINLKYFPLSNTLPVGGRIRLLNEALSEALEKAANSSQVILSSSQKEVKEIYLFVAGEFDVIAGVYSRQGGFFWRPLSKAPGAF